MLYQYLYIHTQCSFLKALTLVPLNPSSYIQHKMMVTMSEQALVDCSWGYGNNGCDGGETFRAYQWIMHNGCIPSEYYYGHYLQQVSW